MAYRGFAWSGKELYVADQPDSLHAVEMVTPNEDMPARIARQAWRILTGTGMAEVRWSNAPTRTLPEGQRPVFSGDTVHVFAGLDATAAGTVHLTIDGGQGPGVSLGDPVVDSALPRIAARERNRHLDADTETLDLALKHRLVTPWTSFIVPLERDEKAEDPPQLRKVRHTVAAGWHGMGTVVAASTPMPRGLSRLSSYSLEPVSSLGPPPMDTPEPGPVTIHELVLWGIEVNVLMALAALVRKGHEEQRVVAAFVLIWIKGEGKNAFDRQIRRGLRRFARRFDDVEQDRIAKEVEQAVAGAAMAI